jgi:hypothetical protein
MPTLQTQLGCALTRPSIDTTQTRTLVEPWSAVRSTYYEPRHHEHHKADTNAQTCLHLHTSARIHTCRACMHAHTHAHTHTYSHTRTHARARTHTHARMCIRTCTCTDASTHARTHAHTGMHAHKHACTAQFWSNTLTRGTCCSTGLPVST